MNDAQHNAVVQVERDKAEIRALTSQLEAAERKLKRSETALRTEIRRDPASWNAVATVKEV